MNYRLMVSRLLRALSDYHVKVANSLESLVTFFEEDSISLLIKLRMRIHRTLGEVLREMAGSLGYEELSNGVSVDIYDALGNLPGLRNYIIRLKEAEERLMDIVRQGKKVDETSVLMGLSEYFDVLSNIHVSVANMLAAIGAKEQAGAAEVLADLVEASKKALELELRTRGIH
jgi:hypothetical protein